jgi:hypothetical protein
MHDLAAIMQTILDGYPLPLHGTHGVVHWARVLENGLRIAEANGAELAACEAGQGGVVAVSTVVPLRLGRLGVHEAHGRARAGPVGGAG